MSSLHLPRVISQRGKTPMEVERENFEKAQAVAINKAINSQVHPVKEKHVRSAILGTFHENGAGVFWATTSKLPLQGNSIVCWKFLHVLHKLLREGHANVILDSQKYISLLRDIGKLWRFENEGHLKDGYGRLIAAYTKLLIQKLSFHKKNPRIPGSLTMTDEQFNKIFGVDVNNYFEVSCDMLDYLDEILALQETVFGSLDMSRSNSMTNSGQCRLAPLIPCILDSCQLYDYLVKSLFKLHSSLPPDTLSGHRDRFLSGYQRLKQFYHQSGTLQYFKNLVQVPLLPDDPPNFLIASDLSKHVKPVAVVPVEPEPEAEAETPEADGIGFLIDTSSPVHDSHDKFDETFGQESMDTFNFNGQPEIDERDVLIERLTKEIQLLREELEQVKLEAQQKVQLLQEERDQLKKMLAELQLAVDNTLKENELLKQEVDEAKLYAANTGKSTDSDKLIKANEEKFKKMKEIYGKLREEHVTLLRSHAEVNKQLKDEKKLAEEKEMLLKETNLQLEQAQQEQKTLQENMQQHSEVASSELEKATTKCESLENTQQELSKEIELLKAQKQQLETDLEDARVKATTLDNSLEKLKSEKEKAEECLKVQMSAMQTELEESKKMKVTTEENLKKELGSMESKMLESESAKKNSEDALNQRLTELEEKLKDSQTAKQGVENQHKETLKKLYKLLVESCVKECNAILQNAMDQSENLPHLTVTCSAEYLLDRTYPVYDSIDKLRTAHQHYKSNEANVHELLVSLNGFSHRLSDCIIHGFATSHSAQVAAGDELTDNCKKAVEESLSTLSAIVQDSEKVDENIEKILEYVKKIQADAETLLPKIADVKDKEIGDMVESEMQSTTAAIELAAERIEAMLKKTSEDNTGASLEVNTSILDACTSLMKCIKVLLEKSRDLQKEIVAQGRGASTAKEFYNKHHRWTEGLITAAKTVGWAATALVEVADRVVQGEGKFEELIVCSKQIAASTAQLVVASKVKADRESKCLAQLSNASKTVNQATGKVVGCAKTASNAVEEKSLMDFTTLSLHQTKQQEMQTQLRVIELENLLKNERIKLGDLRKQHYQLADESEGWEIDQNAKS